MSNRSTQRRREVPFAAGLLCTAALALAVGCNSSSNRPPPGNGTVGTVTSAANGTQFNTPFDAAASPDGTLIFFTGIDSVSGNPSVFKSGAGAGSAASALGSVPVSGVTYGFPSSIAISTDGTTVYVADPAASTTNDLGVIFSIPSGGGNATPLTETADYAPHSISVARSANADAIYFVGTDKADGAVGIFQDRAGTVTTVIKGAAAGNPSLVTASDDGTVYFFDSGRGIQKIAAGGTAATPLGGASAALREITGLAVAQDGSALVAAATDASGKASFQRISVADGSVTPETALITATGEPGGLHRAADTDVYAFADLSAGNSGTVYLLSK
ncbi:MAG: hypothetical protein NVSMB23_26260 [Myxococcales bacterium]